MKREVRKKVEIGTLRIKSRDLKVYEKTSNGWKISKREFPNALEVVKLFKVHGKFDVLRDTKKPEFLKGQVSKARMVQGARINILPDGKVLNKAYSLFAEDLTIHDEKSNNHWDVLYKNPGGGYSHVYTLNKVKRAVREKYKEVEDFGNRYNLLRQSVLEGLKDADDSLALPMYTLLETYMRVGNETYYKANGHKGLTTLKKKDVSIKGKDVEFSYIGKKGVPMDIVREFPSSYLKRLKGELKVLKKNDFIFVNSEGHPLKDTHFMDAFERYCGKRFYPHIVRSYYATQRAKEFLRNKRHATKEEVKELYTSIAEKLGHKKFVKRDGEWKSDFNVTIHYYLQPEMVEKIQRIEQ